MPSAFYNELSKLDPGLADRWKAATNDSIKVVIDKKNAENIFEPLFIDVKKEEFASITENQEQAIIQIFEKLDPRAKLYLIDMVQTDFGDLEHAPLIPADTGQVIFVCQVLS